MDVIKTQPTDEKTSKLPLETLHLSQEYRGLVNMGVKINSNGTIPVTSNNVSSASDYLPCIGCEYNSFNADSVFNCSCV